MKYVLNANVFRRRNKNVLQPQTTNDQPRQTTIYTNKKSCVFYYRHIIDNYDLINAKILI